MLSDWIRLVQILKFYLFATNWCTVELSSGSHGQAAGQRGLTVLGHLAGVFDQSGVAKSFRSVSPYCIAWSDVALHVCHETVPKSQILYAFNGNIVALCIADSRQVIFSIPVCGCRPGKSWPVSNCRVLPPGRCNGLRGQEVMGSNPGVARSDGQWWNL